MKALDATTELVLSVPEPWGAELAFATGARLTLGVLTELLREAKEQVVLSAPYIGQSAGLVGPELSAACRGALKRDVSLAVLSTGEGLESLRQWRRGFGSLAGQIEFYRPAANVTDVRQLGSHAKFCLSDDSAAYIGSANLTGPGLGAHLEMGVLVRGSAAHQLRQFWTSALQRDLFVAVA